MPKKSGFTLIELLVVISIISILSVVGFVSFQNVSAKAKDARMRADIDAIKKAYETNYDPSLNGGQGGYKGLTPSNFASGKIPTTNGQLPAADNSNSYIVTGPVGADSTGGNFAACVNTGDGSKCYFPSQTNCSCVSSTQGTPFTSSSGSPPNPSCDPYGRLAAGLVGYWKMDEGQGQVTTDASSSKINGTLGANSSSATDDPTWQTDQCISGKCLWFDGSNDFVNLGANGDYAFQAGNKWTTSLWFKTNTSGKSMSLMAKNTGYAVAGYEIVIGKYSNQGYDNKVGFVVDNSVGHNQTTSTNNLPIINDGMWHYATVVFDASGASVTGAIYLDGEGYGTLDSGVSISGWATATSNPLKLGRAISGDSTYFFNGQIDEPRVYNRALSPSEVSALYNKGAGCTSP